MEYDKGHLLNIYDAIKDKRENQKEYIKQVQDLDNEIKTDVLEYRIASVKRILDYIHSNQMKIASDLKQFDTLITHCCNKLNGNIDGIELELGDKHDKKDF